MIHDLSDIINYTWGSIGVGMRQDARSSVQDFTASSGVDADCNQINTPLLTLPYDGC